MASGPNSPETRKRLEELFLQALEVEPQKRAAFLDEACESDPDLRAEVEAMLVAHEDAAPTVEKHLQELATALYADGDLIPGASLGSYRLVELIGQGGMGAVFRAFDPELEREVALKVLPSEVAGDPDRLARFEREGKALAAIRHPGVVKIFSVEESDGYHFLTMELVEGETLGKQIPAEGMELDRCWELALQTAEALAAAHELGIVHRDLKPNNILVDGFGKAVVVDFGLVKRSGSERVGDDSRAAPVRTQTGAVMGTWKYMSPEQARGDIVDERTDVFSFGIVLYQMLAGRRPFEHDSQAEVVAAILHERPIPLVELRPAVPQELCAVVERCLEKDPQRRYRSGAEIRDALRDAKADLEPTALSSEGSIPPQGAKRRRLVAVAVVAVLVLAAAGSLLWSRRGRAREQWARTEAIPEVLRLIGENRLREAAELGFEAEEVVGTDAILEPLWPQMTSPFEVVSDPPGAKILYRPYESEEPEWQTLGMTPFEDDRFPAGAFLFKIEKEGFQSTVRARSLVPASHLVEIANSGLDYLQDPSYIISLRLETPGTFPEDMVSVGGGLYGTVPVLGFAPVSPVEVPAFLIDRIEVTNGAFQEFVAAGGYDEASLWTELFKRGDEVLEWEEAVATFLDDTGRAGPATWLLAQPPPGTEALPVAGVSWFEAAAYCRWRGRKLPTLYHWARAALPSSDVWMPFNPFLARASNFGGDGPASDDEQRGIGISGARDLVGNVREWASTSSRQGRYLLGGAWSDPAYFLHEVHATSPWQRAETDGFRCAIYPEGDPPEHLTVPVDLPPQDYSGDTELPDRVFETVQRFASYDKSLPLAASLDSSVELDWAVQEWVSIDTVYGDRLPLRLHLPKRGVAPYQPLVFFPGGNVLRSSEMEDLSLGFLVRSGRAVVEPAYDGTFQRNDGSTLQRWSGEGSRELLNHWVQDLGRTIDYLEERPDLDGDRVSFLGLSLGAGLVPNLVPFEPRFRTAILYSGGFAAFEPQPLLDYRIGLARRLEIPILMLGGRNDFTMPTESQREMFRFFGTPAENKRLVIYDAGHWPLPMNEVIRETVGFLDRHLGPVAGGPAPSEAVTD